jgi:hypothetical protein
MRRCDIAPGTKAPHDGTAEVPIHLDAGGHKSVTGVQMARMRPVLAPVTSGNADRAARMNNEDIQQGGTVGRGRDRRTSLSPASHHTCMHLCMCMLCVMSRGNRIQNSIERLDYTVPKSKMLGNEVLEKT